MKCHTCDGNGRLEVEDNGVVMQGVYWRCPTCGGKGIVEPLTNEEWLKSLDTEGLVDYLYEVFKGGNTVERQFWIEKHKERFKMQFRGWLKEKHE